MMFYSEALRVVLATVHIALADVPRALTAGVARGDHRADRRELPRFGIARPRIAVAGLNPHAGEHGLFGSEEDDGHRARRSRRAARAGSTSSGPFPADTVFVRARRGEFDVVVACYHDQGLIPVKLRGVRPGGERDAGAADRPDLGRSRHGVRHRRQGRGRSGEYDRGRAAGGAAGIGEHRVARRLSRAVSDRSPERLRADRTPMAEKTEREKAQANIAENRKAFHDYHLLETFEAGWCCSAPR